MKPVKTYVFILVMAFVAVVGLVACSHPGRDKLLMAEALMAENADSALVVMQTVDASCLNGDRDRALYGLLLTQALDKNHAGLPPDSVIGFSSRYYGSSGDYQHAMRAYYYHGRVKYCDGAYAPALVMFFKAREIAGALGDEFWLGMSCRGISDIYCMASNSADELRYAQEEVDHFIKSGNWLYARYAKLDLARALSRSGDQQMAVRLAREALDTARVLGDCDLEYNATSCLGYGLLMNNEPVEAANVFGSLCCMNDACAGDSALLAMACLESSKPAEALAIVDVISADAEGLGSYVRYKAYKALGKNHDAFEESERYHSLKFGQIEDKMKYALAGAFDDYHQMYAQNTRMELRSARLTIWLVVLCGVLIIAVGLVVLRNFITRQRRILDERIVAAGQLQERLNIARTEKTDADIVIKSLFASKFELLEDLCSVYVQYADANRAKRLIATKVLARIENLVRDEAQVAELERQVNLYYDGLFEKFRNDLPGLKEAYYKVFLFLVLGFSSNSIMLLLGEDKVNVVYELKRRLKNKIRQLPEDKMAMYMRYLA